MPLRPECCEGPAAGREGVRGRRPGGRDRSTPGGTASPRGRPGRLTGRRAAWVAAGIAVLACGPGGGDGGADPGAANGGRTEAAAGPRAAASSVATTPPGDTAKVRYGIRLSTDRAVYAPGDTVRMRLEVFRRGGEPLTLSFSTAQRFDFVLRGPDSTDPTDEVWRWSDGRFFAQSTGTVTLDADRPSITATAAHPAPGDPGLYRLEGGLSASEWPISAVVPFTVAP